MNKPSTIEVKSYLEKWDSLENYVQQESSLKKLFTHTYPNNVSIDDVLIKVCSLNDFYSTNIFSPFTVARHIVQLKIDQKLKEGDLTIVNQIAEVTMNGNKKKNFYSFATKYCSHHKPTVYPIYDSFVDKMLLHLKKEDQFYDFNKNDLKQYPKYRDVLLKFRTYYGLEEFTLKDIDKIFMASREDIFPEDIFKIKP